ncbi:Hypothetical predicted protein, partial [Paramuricea clavata]
MPDKSNRKRHRSDRTPSPSERSRSKDPENRGHRQDQHKRRRENNIGPGVNEETTVCGLDHSYGVEPTNINEITNPNFDVSEEETSCEFFDPESTSQRRWSHSDPFVKFLEKNMRRRLYIIEESSLPEAEACVAPLLDKQILNYIPANRKKFVEQRDKDLALIQRTLLNSAATAGPLCCLHDRLENQAKISNEELLNTLQQSLCLLGSANHIVTTNRLKKILGAINPDKAQWEDLPSLAANHSELSRSLAKNLQQQCYSAIPHSSGGSPAAFVRPENKYNYSEPNQV